MKILLGCPIYKREWIIHHWIRDVLTQSVDISNIGFVFEVSPDDTTIIEVLQIWKNISKEIPYFNIKVRDDIPHFEHEENTRKWTISKYENMVSLRNSLLQTAREVEPDFYFSLDSDILLENPNTLELLIAHIKSGADAVSPLMFMTPIYDMYPSIMTWRNDGTNKALRQQSYPIGSYFQTDVIMAAKMMSKNVYQNVDYVVHEQGEDVGWSYECFKKDYKLFSASYIYAPHIMSQNMYARFLSEGDPRHRDYCYQSNEVQ
jgi:hypothetical protein